MANDEELANLALQFERWRGQLRDAKSRRWALGKCKSAHSEAEKTKVMRWLMRLPATELKKLAREELHRAGSRSLDDKVGKDGEQRALHDVLGTDRDIPQRPRPKGIPRGYQVEAGTLYRDVRVRIGSKVRAEHEALVRKMKSVGEWLVSASQTRSWEVYGDFEASLDHLHRILHEPWRILLAHALLQHAQAVALENAGIEQSDPPRLKLKGTDILAWLTAHAEEHGLEPPPPALTAKMIDGVLPKLRVGPGGKGNSGKMTPEKAAERLILAAEHPAIAAENTLHLADVRLRNLSKKRVNKSRRRP